MILKKRLIPSINRFDSSFWKFTSSDYMHFDYVDVWVLS